MASFSWTVQPSNWTISMRSSSGAGIVSTTFAVGSSYPPIDMRLASKWSRVDDLFAPRACALQRTGVDLGYVTEQRRFPNAGRRRNYDDYACHSAIERIQKSAAIGFRRVPLVPQSEPSSAATTTLSAVDLSLYGVARFGQGILGSHRRARTLGRRAAFAGSVGVENELFVDITVLQ